MATRGPWSVKGIDSKAREAALQAARSEGITLGDYLNRLLLEGETEDNEMSALPKNQASNDASSQFALEALDKLTRRIEAVEAKSTLAITGIDQSVVGLLSRLENSDNARSAIEGRLELASDEIRQAQQILEKRIQRMETDDTGLQNLRALKSLENALGRLAQRVEDQHAETTKSREEVGAVTARMDDLSGNVDHKISKLTEKVERTLDSAAGSIAKAVEQAELRTEGAARHLSERMSKLEADLFEEKRGHDERFTAIESKMTGTLNNVSENIDRLGERMAKSEAHTVKALTYVDDQKSTLAEFAERLNRAETTTDSALRELEHHFNRLDNKLGEFDSELDGGISGLKKHLEDRVKTVAIELANTISAIRDDLIDQIEVASNGPTEAFAEINTAVSELHKRMKKAEKRQNDAIEAIGEEFARLTQSLDRRVSSMEDRNDSDLTSGVRDQIDALSESLDQRIRNLESRDGGEGIQAVTQQMNELADVLDRRVTASEERSAAAIRDFTEHVTTLTRNLSAKQEKGLQQISGEIKASEERQGQRLETALSGVKERIAQVEQATSSSMSPIQKAMASLADRLQAVEDFATPPGAPRPEAENLNLVSFEETLNKVNAETAPKPAAEPKKKAEDRYTPADTFSDIPDIPEPDDDMPFKSSPLADLEALPDSWADDEDAFTAPGMKLDDEFAHDDGFTADLPDSADAGFDLDAANADPDELDDGFAAPPGPNDYLARARAAANASMENSRSRMHSPKKAQKSGGSSKLPLVAAASVLALSAAGTAGFMMMRGKQSANHEPFIAVPSTSMSVDMAAEGSDADADAETTALDSESTEEAAPAEKEAEAKATTQETKEEAPPPPTKKREEAAPAPVERMEPANTETREPRPEPVRAAEAAPQPSRAIEAAPEPKRTAAAPSIQPQTPAPAPVEAAPALPASVLQYQQGMDAINSGRIPEGFALIRQSADAGQPSAQYRLAKLYERGQGVPRDLAMSRQWTEQAAKGGNVKAMHDLAVFYAEGEGGPQSYPGAVQWFRVAADHGLVDSQFNLGVLYEQGLGVTANPAEALYWFRVAEKLGDDAAAEKVRELVSMVTPEEAAKTARLAGQYRAKPSDPMANGRFPTSEEARPASIPAAALDPALVLEAQILLNALGYHAGAPDGEFGTATRDAILTFQRANGYPESSQVTPTLIRQLRAEAGQ